MMKNKTKKKKKFFFPVQFSSLFFTTKNLKNVILFQ